MNIKRDRDRVKKTGEVFTPIPLVDEMLMKLYAQDPTLFTNPDKTFLEPACGDGNFLVRILHFKIKFFREANPEVEVPIERILRSIYGIDLMSDNVKHAKERMIQVVKDELGIACESKIKNLQKILSGRDGRYGNIVQASGLEWDCENWCPKKDNRQIEQQTEGMIRIKTKAELEATVAQTLAALGSKPTKAKKEKPELNPMSDDLFSFTSVNSANCAAFL